MKSHIKWQSCRTKTGAEVHGTVLLLWNSWNYLHLVWCNAKKILLCHFSWISRSRKHVKPNIVLQGLSWFWLHQNWHPAVGRCLYQPHLSPRWQSLWELRAEATTLRPLKVSVSNLCRCRFWRSNVAVLIWCESSEISLQHPQNWSVDVKIYNKFSIRFFLLFFIF